MGCNCKNIANLMEEGEREEQTLVEKAFDWVKDIIVMILVTAIVIFSLPLVGLYVILSIIITRKVIYPKFLTKQENS